MIGTFAGRREQRWLNILALFAFAFGIPSLLADEPRDTMELAISQYLAALSIQDSAERCAQFGQSQLLFAKAVKSLDHPSADLLVNLGNAAVQAGNHGPAVVAYRRALRIDPANRRATSNLEHVRSLLPEWTRHDTPARLWDSIFVWNDRMTRERVVLLAAAAFFVAAGMLAVSIRYRQPMLRHLALLPALIWIVIVASLLPTALQTSRLDAVVIATEVVGRSADAASATAQFTAPIPGGTEVGILEQRENWTQIELSNQQTAWVPTSTLEVL